MILQIYSWHSPTSPSHIRNTYGKPCQKINFTNIIACRQCSSWAYNLGQILQMGPIHLPPPHKKSMSAMLQGIQRAKMWSWVVY